MDKSTAVQMYSNLKVGDKVLTGSGFYTITQTSEHNVYLNEARYSWLQFAKFVKKFNWTVETKA